MREKRGVKTAPEECLLYGTSHAAALVGCDPGTLRAYARTGLIRPLKSSTGRHMWHASDLRKVLEHRAGKRNCPAPIRGDELK
jgi:hypothetical protein